MRQTKLRVLVGVIKRLLLIGSRLRRGFGRCCRAIAILVVDAEVGEFAKPVGRESRKKLRSRDGTRKKLRSRDGTRKKLRSRDESRKKLRHVKPAARGFGSRDGREGAKG